MSLSEIVSQDKAITSLQKAFASGRLAHAYIFAGPDGVGRYATAVQWARMLLCSERIETTDAGGNLFYDSCGKCPSCLFFDSNAHPDFKPIYKELVKFTKEGKNKKPPVDLPVDVIREFLIETAANRPQISRAVVYVVQESEKLNPSSQNALLKVVEEPPSHCIIILICSRVDKMLPTVLSRCQVIRFGPVDKKFVKQRLLRMGLDERRAQFWSAFGGGSIGLSENWANLEKNGADCYQIKSKIVERLAAHVLSDSVDFADWLVKQAGLISSAMAQSEDNLSRTDLNRRAAKGLIEMIIHALNDAMHFSVGGTETPVNSDQTGQIGIIAAQFSPEELADMINAAYEKIQWIDASVNEKLIFEELLLKLAGCGILM